MSWTPPPSPDPSSILRDAVADTERGDYQSALAKHLWFFEHALEYEPSQYGVRLSFALRYWKDLADRYPPALEALSQLRDTAADGVLSGGEVRESFMDAMSLNRVLDNRDATRELFHQLHESNADHAAVVYQIAQPILVQAGDYALCNEYLQAETAIDHLIELFQLHRDRPASDPAADRHRQYAEITFRNETATVIALLVVAGRSDEAKRLSQQVASTWDDESVHTAIAQALNGEFPPQSE